MALGLLWLCLTLPWALKTQAQNSTHEMMSGPSLNRAPLQPDFQDDQFQREWHVIGWAQNTNENESISHVNMYRNNFELKDDRSYNVTSLWARGQDCTLRVDTFVPTDLPGQYVLKDVTGYKGLQNLTMKVVETDYKQYAVVFYEAIFENRVYLECVLYATEKKKRLGHGWKSHFSDLARSMGFHLHYMDSTVLKTVCNIETEYID